MKIIVILFLVCFLGTNSVHAQNRKIYVSTQGGKPKLLYGFKNGYNSSYYTNGSEKCDTLICRGVGYERCFLDKKVFGYKHAVEAKYYRFFNFAIRKTEKHIKKTNTKEGVFSLARKGRNISIRYSNADKKGNTDMLIEIL